jgi:hypothetical protein
LGQTGYIIEPEQIYHHRKKIFFSLAMEMLLLYIAEHSAKVNSNLIRRFGYEYIR